MLRRFRLNVIAMMMMLVGCTSSLIIMLDTADADTVRPPAPAEPYPISAIEGYTVQETDMPLESAAPMKPLDRSDKRLGDALAWYMKGRLQLERKELELALESFTKSVHLNPKAIDGYQAAIPLLLQKGRLKEAKDLSLQAATNSEKGFDLVMTVAALFARSDQLSESISVLQSALNLSTINDEPAQDLLVRRDLGLYLRLRNDIEAASSEYQTVFAAVSDPKLPKDVFDKVMSDPGKFFDEFGDVFLKAEQPELALKAYEEAAKHREAKPGLHSFNLATVFQKTNQSEKALVELQKYFDAKLKSRGRAAYELFKTLLKETGQESELLSRLEAMWKADKQNEVLRFFIADELLAAKQFDKAEKLYRENAPSISDPRALVGMLTILREKSDMEELLTMLTKAYQTVPRAEDDEALQNLAPDVRSLSQSFEKELTALKEDSKTLDSLSKHAHELSSGDDATLDFFQSYVLGKLSVESERTDDAIYFYKFAIGMRNDPPGLLYRELGNYLLDSKNYEQAIEVLTEAVDHPSSQVQREKWMFLFFLSYAYELSGKTDEAVDAIREAQKLDDLPRLKYQEAWIFYHARQWDTALKLFNDVVDKYKNRRDEQSLKLVQDAMFRISNIYVEQGDSKRGVEVLEEVLERDPDNVQANNDLGYLWADQNENLERAKEMIEKALAAEPDNPAYQDSMGWVLYRMGKYEEAHTYLDKAVKHENGEDSTLFDHLGDCLRKLNRESEAQAIWRKALKLEEEKSAPSEKLLKSLKEKIQ